MRAEQKPRFPIQYLVHIVVNIRNTAMHKNVVGKFLKKLYAQTLEHTVEVS